MSTLPSKARAVIIGGGVAGCSVAYHLAELGWTDIVLLERKQLTSGTTWHAAGLIGQGRGSHSLQKMSTYSADLYERLEAETGISTGFRRNGSLSVVKEAEREQEVLRLADQVKQNGLDLEMLSPAECTALYPYLNQDLIRCGLHIPSDGQTDPANVALSLAKGARQKGVKIFENVKVTAIEKVNDRVSGVMTDQGRIDADYVVNCAGMWGQAVGEMAGVNTPLHACEHFYIVTEVIKGLPNNLPVMRCADDCTYFKEDAGKILLGAFEPKAKPWGMDGIREDFCFDELPEDFDHFSPFIESAIELMPVLETAGIRTFFNGPESFTPDMRWMMGEALDLENYYTLCGFNSIGIVSSGGAGKALAEWMDAGEPPFDLWDLDIRRMQPFQQNRLYLKERVRESLGLLYADHFPYRQPETARGIRRSPLHELLKAEGATFGVVAGIERANWFADEGQEAAYQHSWGRANWFDNHAREHRAIREGVGLFDMSSFGKIRVEGRDAEVFLQRLCACDLAVPPGAIVYGQMLNQKGGIECDLTINRLSETAFLLVVPAATVQRDQNWLRRHLRADEFVVITDVSAAEAVICLMGPKSRDLLSAVSPNDFSLAANPFATWQTIEIGMGIARAHRISYVGELGWELYVDTDQACHVFEAIREAGADHDLKLCGLHTLDSCRIEKAFRHFGHDITDEDHVLEAGLGFAVKTKKGDFIGRDAVLKKKDEGLRNRMLQFQLLDPEPLLFHGETILRDGEPVSYLTSGNYGHHLGGAIGLGYVPCEGESLDQLLASSFEIKVAGQPFKAKASFKPLYDPKGDRVRV